MGDGAFRLQVSDSGPAQLRHDFSSDVLTICAQYLMSLSTLQEVLIDLLGREAK